MPPESPKHDKISMKNNITLTIIRIRSKKNIYIYIYYSSF
jgi:hypothetical protein